MRRYTKDQKQTVAGAGTNPPGRQPDRQTTGTRTMKITQQENRLTVLAPAKVNLHLEVLGKRPDGYHEIETLMVTVSLADELTFEPAADGQTTLLCSEPAAGPVADNLVTKAVQLVRQQSGRQDGVTITLEKRIPVAAGLAGGSSDAAATLVALNRLWNLQWSVEHLAKLSEQLGSDLPFFFSAPAAICRGRGERVTPVTPGDRLDLVLVYPAEGLSTAAVYRAVSLPDRPAPMEPMSEAFVAGDKPAIAKRLHNRLQDASERISPVVAALARQARDWDCLGTLMSGSGSTFFALCASPAQAQALGTRLLAETGHRRGSTQFGSIFVVHTTLEDA